MRERPILFSAPMVRAILAGRKTQTRRTCKPQPSDAAHTTSADGKPMQAWWETGKDINYCPYGRPGDRLWVRETWGLLFPDLAPDSEPTWYRATDDEPGQVVPAKWRPSIHMPRHRSRITLEVTGVRVERLNAISDEDAAAEGVEYQPGRGIDSCRVAFAELWEQINGTGTWDANPWVWVVDFRPITP